MRPMAVRPTDPMSLRRDVDRLEERTALLMVRFDDLRQEMARGDEALRHAIDVLRQDMLRGDAALQASIDALRDDMLRGDAALMAEMNRRFERLERFFAGIGVAVLAPWLIQWIAG